MRWRLAPGTNAYVEKEIIPKLDPTEYEILKRLANDIKNEATQEE
jgi:hypothetical protein